MCEDYIRNEFAILIPALASGYSEAWPKELICPLVKYVSFCYPGA